jgi:DNA-binding XRE family transcriptional regulator
MATEVSHGSTAPVTWIVSSWPHVRIAAVPAEFHALRDQLGLTQEKAGRIVGLSQPTVSKAETGRHPVSARVLMRLAGLYVLATAKA